MLQRFTQKQKIGAGIILVVLMVAAIVGSIMYYNKNQPVIGDVPSVVQGLAPKQDDPQPPRPTSEPNWYLEDTVDENVSPPPGEGLVGEARPELELSSDMWQEVHLPMEGQISDWAGNSLKISADKIQENQKIKAWVYPSGTSMEDDRTFEVELTPNETTRDPVYNLLLPTNLATGTYTIRVQGYEEIYFFDILINPYGELHAK